MVTYKLASNLESVGSRRTDSRPLKLAETLLGLLVVAIMGTAIYMGSKPPQPQKGCDHVSYLAGRCHE